MPDLKGRVVILTGASSGIGLATAKRLAHAGARVALLARRESLLHDLARELTPIAKPKGGACLPLVCDVASRESVNEALDAARDRLGPPDALINNAGVMLLSTLEKNRVEEWEQQIDVNIKGVLYCTAHALPQMIARKGGHVVNVSSVAGRRVFPGAAVYCGTKFFVHAFSEGLRSETFNHNIRVTIIAPGLVTTELHQHTSEPEQRARMDARPPMRWLDADDVAREIVHALETPEHVALNEVLIRPTEQER
ncbi:MAG: SDR family oxidoreductase [Phycisphaerales bacterium]